MGMLRGTAMSPVDLETWKSAQTCASGSLAHKMACWTGKPDPDEL